METTCEEKSCGDNATPGGKYCVRHGQGGTLQDETRQVSGMVSGNHKVLNIPGQSRGPMDVESQQSSDAPPSKFLY
jgi:hypothetical protein